MRVTKNSLRWKCRRGMLELDILLNNFLDKTYSNLSAPEKQCFVTLLEVEDTTLLALLMGKIAVVEMVLQDVIRYIQQSTDSKS